jgi:hypothetical protein
LDAPLINQQPLPCCPGTLAAGKKHCHQHTQAPGYQETMSLSKLRHQAIFTPAINLIDSMTGNVPIFGS